MHGRLLRRIALFLVIILIANIMVTGLFASQRVAAGFLGDYQGSVLTIIKGLVMFWILNLMRKNATDNGQDDLITSTIKKGLNLDLNDVTGTADSTNNDTSNNQDTNNNSGNTADDTTSTPANDQVVIEETAVSQDIQLSDEEQSMIDMINQTRQDEGLNALDTDPQLVELARKKAGDMIENNYFAHQSPDLGSPFDMLNQAGIEYSLAGENLAAAGSITQAFNSLMASPEHRDNILKSRYDRVGVGVVKGGKYGLMIVQLFVDSIDPAR